MSMDGLVNQKTVIDVIFCKEKTFQLVLVSVRIANVILLMRPYLQVSQAFGKH